MASSDSGTSLGSDRSRSTSANDGEWDFDGESVGVLTAISNKGGRLKDGGGFLVVANGVGAAGGGLEWDGSVGTSEAVADDSCDGGMGFEACAANAFGASGPTFLPFPADVDAVTEVALDFTAVAFLGDVMPAF